MPASRVSGGSRVVAIYARKLAARGHEVRIVWHRMRPVPWGQRIRNRLKGRDRTAKARSPYLDGADVIQITAPEPGIVGDSVVPDGDAVIATWWNTAFEVSALSPSKGAKFYFVQHHEVHGHLPYHLARGSYYLPLRKITIAHWLVDVMAEEYGDRDVALVPNSVDTELFRAPARDKNPAPVVGFMYSETTYKGVDLVTQAIARARAAVPNLEVVAFGKKPPSGHLPLPPGTRYFRDPSQAAIRDIYAMCDAWMMGSRSEGFGLPLLEAMACRTPVISTRTGAAPDLVENGREGWVVNVGDAAAMADRLVALAGLDAVAWRSMSDAAYARAHSYTWDAATDLFETALLRGIAPASPDRAFQKA